MSVPSHRLKTSCHSCPRLKRSCYSCPRQVNASNKITSRRNDTTDKVWNNCTDNKNVTYTNISTKVLKPTDKPGNAVEDDKEKEEEEDEAKSEGQAMRLEGKDR